MEFLIWMVVRTVLFVGLTIWTLHDWTIGAAMAGACTLIHAETIYEGRRRDRELLGRWRD